MDNSAIFKIILTKTISYKSIHFIFILIEYFILILPSTLTSSKKILYIFNDTDQSIPSIQNPYFLFRMLNQYKQTLSSVFPVIIVSIGMVFLLLYLSLYFFYKPKEKAITSLLLSITQSITTNIFEFILFRYLSFFFIDSIMFMISYSSSENTINSTVVTIVLVIVLIIYLMTIVHYICTYAIIFNIENPLITYKFPHYPFSSIMIECDLFLLLIKVIISIDNNSLFRMTNHFYINSFVNISYLLLIIVLPIKLLFINGIIQFNEAYYWTNSEIYILRYFLMMFNLVMTFCILLFSEYSEEFTLLEVIFYAIASLMLSLIITQLFKSYIKKILLNGDLNVNKMILLMISKYFEKNMTTNEYIPVIFNNILLVHLMKCESKCSFCKEFSSKKTLSTPTDDSEEEKSILHMTTQDVSNKIDFIYKLIRRKTSRMFVKEKYQNDKSNEILYELLNLLYYRITKKIFKFFYHYSKFKKTYSLIAPLLIHNIDLLVNCFFRDDNSSQSETIFFHEVLTFSEINVHIYKSLIALKEFTSSEISCQFPEKIIELSKSFAIIRCSLLKGLLKAKIKDEEMYQDFSMRTMRNILKYSLILARYIIETLFNESYKVLSPLDIELLEDYLNIHYSNDKALIISVSFPKTNKMPSLNILKFTGFLASHDYKTLPQYFPKEIMKEGHELFINKLYKYFQCKNDENAVKKGKKSLSKKRKNDDVFQFVMQNKSYLEYFRYSFQLPSEILNQSLLVFGFYTIDYTNIILIEIISQKDQILLGFSKNIKNLLCFKSKWIELLSKGEIFLTLKNIFDNIHLSKKNTIEDKTMTNETCNEYDCLLRYDKYSPLLLSYFEHLLTLDDINKNKKEIEAVKQSKERLKTKHNTIRVLKMKKLFEITPTKIVFCVISYQQTTKYDCTEITVNQYVQEQFDNITVPTINMSSSSMQERSTIRQVNLYSELDDKSKQIEDKKSCQAERKRMQMFSLLTFILSLSIIVVCFIFIFVQMSITKNLRAVTDIYTQYKTTRLSFVSSFNSFTSTLCYSQTSNDQSCINALTTYSEMLHREHGLPSNIYVQDYMSYELKCKMNFFLDKFINLKRMLINLNDETLIAVPLVLINFTEIDLSEANTINARRLNFTFEDGLRHFHNLYEIITAVNYTTIPFYYITMEKALFRFTVLEKLNRTLTETEIAMYTVAMNFYNFDSSFRWGEKTILGKFNYLKNQNLTFLIICIILEISMNCILLFLSRENILTAYDLFREIIDKIIEQIEDHDYKKYFLGKIDCLVSISLLYASNPISLIKAMKKTKEEYKELVKAKNKTTEGFIKTITKPTNNKSTTLLKFSNDNDTPLTNKTPVGNPKPIVKEKQYKLLDNIYRNEIVQYIKVNWILFISIFIFIALFDIILIDRFNTVFTSFGYVVDNFNLENWYNTDMAYQHLPFLINTTEVDLAEIIHEDITKMSLFDYYLQETFNTNHNINKFISIRQAKYPPLENYFTYECNEVVKKINDSFIINGSKLFNANYTAVSVYLCERYNLLHLPNFEFVHRYLISRIRMHYYNNIGKREYSDLANYSRSDQMIEAYLIQLFFLRPLKKYYVVISLTPFISGDLKDYMTFVIWYMVLNSLIQLFVFGIIQWFVVRKLANIQDDLFLMKKSFNG